MNPNMMLNPYNIYGMYPNNPYQYPGMNYPGINYPGMNYPGMNPNCNSFNNTRSRIYRPKNRNKTKKVKPSSIETENSEE